VTQFLNFLNQFPERYNSQPIANAFTDFVKITDPLLPIFEEVLRDRGSPHFDDAAYMLGWLAYHRGQVSEALERFVDLVSLVPGGDSAGSEEYEAGSLDYPWAALDQLTRIFRTFLPADVVGFVENNKTLSSHSIAWYTALAQLYHQYQYDLVMTGARRALDNFDIIVEELPVTTDPRRIADYLTKLNSGDDWYLHEIVYLYHSSRELAQIESTIRNAQARPDATTMDDVRQVVEKYSLISDSVQQEMWSSEDSQPYHKDLRQSQNIASKAIESLPKTRAYAKFRNWLHYKRIRLLAQFDPVAVPDAIAELRDEFPESPVLDDAMAEQVFAEAVIVGDMAKATETFDALVQQHPRSNALDNAHSWMAIGWTCAGQPEIARKFDQEIVRRFPRTRHAGYARERIQSPRACAALLELYLWDYEAMRWRQRYRVDTIQARLKGEADASAMAPGGAHEPAMSLAALPNPEDRPAPAGRLTRVQAIDRVSNLFQLHMQPGQQALPQLNVYYADPVDYYGQTSTLEEVLKDKRSYFEWWPVRYYKLDYESIEADCSADQLCSIKGYFDWAVLSTKRLDMEVGTATFEYAISANPPYPVVRETSEVVQRH
jgi:hypothetical protein